MWWLGFDWKSVIPNSLQHQGSQPAEEVLKKEESAINWKRKLLVFIRKFWNILGIIPDQKKVLVSLKYPNHLNQDLLLNQVIILDFKGAMS